MSDFETQGVLEFNADEFVDGMEEASDASADLANNADDAEESLWDLEPAGLAAGGAMAGIGVAAQETLDGTRDVRESLDRTAETMGVADDALTDLLIDMTDATFAHEDAAFAMDEFAQMGVETEAEMQELVETSDLLADAVDADIAEITDLAGVMNALDGDMSALTEDTDAFTEAIRNSQLDASDLGSTISRLNFEEMEEMGLQTTDLTGLLAEFADETGFSGKQLRSNFNQAIEEADGDVEALTEELGLGEDALAEWNERIEEAEGTTEDHAAAVGDNTSTMDDLRAAWDDAQLQAAEFLGPVDALAPAMMGLGGAAMTMSTINTTALVPSFAALMTTILPLVAVAGALALAWKTDFMGIRDTVDDSIGFLTDDVFPAGVGAVETLVDAGESATGFVSNEFGPVLDSAGETVEAWEPPIMTAADALGDFLIPGVETAADIFEWGFELQMDIMELWVETSTSGLELIFALLRLDFDDAVSAAGDIWDSTFGALGDTISDAGPNVREQIGDLRETVTEPFDNLREDIVDSVDYIVSTDDDSLVGDVRSAFGQLGDAVTNPLQDVWNETLGGFGFEIDGFSIKIPDEIPSVGGEGFTWDGFSANIPKMAHGGIIEDTGLVEITNPPETVVPRDVRDLPDSAGDDSTSSDGSSGTTIIIEQLIASDPQSTAHQLKQTMRAHNLDRSG